MAKDYRQALRAKGFKPMTDAQRDRLRTVKAPGTAELVGDSLYHFRDPATQLMEN